jgi:hypothetical protein
MRTMRLRAFLPALAALHLAGACDGGAPEVVEDLALAADCRSAPTGRVAIDRDGEPVIVEVPLALAELGPDQMLRNHLVHFDQSDESSPGQVEVPLPKLTADERGCFCYQPGSHAFAYVHTFHHATRFVAAYNTQRAAVGLAPVENLSIRLAYYPGQPQSGFRSRDRVFLDYDKDLPGIDPFLIAHELGHAIDPGGRPVVLEGVEGLEFFGVLEGTANVLAALVSGQTAQVWHLFDAPPASVDTFVRFPDHLITERQVVERALAAPRFLAAYPTMREWLEGILPESTDGPDPYFSSAVTNQPLWQARARYGADAIMQLYLRALRDWTGPSTYLNLAQRLVGAACATDPALSARLLDASRERGLPVTSVACPP